MSITSLHGQTVADLTLVYRTQICAYTGPLPQEAGGFRRCTGGYEATIQV